MLLACLSDKVGVLFSMQRLQRPFMLLTFTVHLLQSATDDVTQPSPFPKLHESASTRALIWPSPFVSTSQP